METDRLEPAARLAWRWLVLFFLVASAAAVGQVAAPVDLSAELEALRGEHSAPGLVAVVTNERGLVAQGAAGVRVLELPEPILADDLVHIGSITKPFTATLVAMEVDAGKATWETTLAEALPTLADGMRAEYRPITIAQLLSMEAGIQPFEEETSPEFRGIPPLSGDVRAQRHAFAAYALSLEPVNAPGTAFRYSNAGHAIAAAILESIERRPWEELVRERIFEPLGMTTAGFGWPNVRDPKAPWGHVEKEGELVPTPPDDPYRLPLWLAPAGDLSMSLPDLAKFARAHLLGYDGKSELLEPETFRKMHTRRIRSGLGWGSTTLLGHEPVATFSGSADTFLAMIALVHDSDLAVMVAANSATEGTEAALRAELKGLVAKFAGDRSSPEPDD